jgi:hypothetical protein
MLPRWQGLLEQAMLKESSPAEAAEALDNSHVMALHSCCPLDYANIWVQNTDPAAQLTFVHGWGQLLPLPT